MCIGKPSGHKRKSQVLPPDAHARKVSAVPISAAKLDAHGSSPGELANEVTRDLPIALSNFRTIEMIRESQLSSPASAIDRHVGVTVDDRHEPHDAPASSVGSKADPNANADQQPLIGLECNGKLHWAARTL